MAGIDSNCLKQKREKILALWEERSLKEVPSAEAAESLALRNSLPIYLDHLSEALATNRRMDVRSVVAHDKEAVRIGRLHGADRAGRTQYVLTEVIFEYHILREVIFEVLEAEGPLDTLQRDIILDSIEQAVNDAAVKFSEVHAEIQQKFIDTLTHDLKTPLAAAKLSAQIVMRRSDRPDACLALAGRIVGNLNRLDAMIHDLLDASRVRAGEALALKTEPVELDGLVREVVDEMAVVHANPLSVDSNEQFEGNWSLDGLRRTIENLVDNAAKYGAPGAPIVVSIKRKDDRVELAVHNEGEPIPPSEIPHLLQHHGRARSAQASTKKGWGLGLTLVQGVADAHKGRLRVESSQAGGTSFIVELPCA
jgi:signal transduction histidine kinase